MYTVKKIFALGILFFLASVVPHNLQAAEAAAEKPLCTLNVILHLNNDINSSGDLATLQLGPNHTGAYIREQIGKAIKERPDLGAYVDYIDSFDIKYIYTEGILDRKRIKKAVSNWALCSSFFNEKNEKHKDAYLQVDNFHVHDCLHVHGKGEGIIVRFEEAFEMHFKYLKGKNQFYQEPDEEDLSILTLCDCIRDITGIQPKDQIFNDDNFIYREQMAYYFSEKWKKTPLVLTIKKDNAIEYDLKEIRKRLKDFVKKDEFTVDDNGEVKELANEEAAKAPENLGTGIGGSPASQGGAASGSIQGAGVVNALDVSGISDLEERAVSREVDTVHTVKLYVESNSMNSMSTIYFSEGDTINDLVSAIERAVRVKDVVFTRRNDSTLIAGQDSLAGYIKVELELGFFHSFTSDTSAPSLGSKDEYTLANNFFSNNSALQLFREENNDPSLKKIALQLASATMETEALAQDDTKSELFQYPQGTKIITEESHVSALGASKIHSEDTVDMTLDPASPADVEETTLLESVGALIDLDLGSEEQAGSANSYACTEQLIRTIQNELQGFYALQENYNNLESEYPDPSTQLLAKQDEESSVVGDAQELRALGSIDDLVGLELGAEEVIADSALGVAEQEEQAGSANSYVCSKGLIHAIQAKLQDLDTLKKSYDTLLDKHKELAAGREADPGEESSLVGDAQELHALGSIRDLVGLKLGAEEAIVGSAVGVAGQEEQAGSANSYVCSKELIHAIQAKLQALDTLKESYDTLLAKQNELADVREADPGEASSVVGDAQKLHALHNIYDLFNLELSADEEEDIMSFSTDGDDSDDGATKYVCSKRLIKAIKSERDIMHSLRSENGSLKNIIRQYRGMQKVTSIYDMLRNQGSSVIATVDCIKSVQHAKQKNAKALQDEKDKNTQLQNENKDLKGNQKKGISKVSAGLIGVVGVVVGGVGGYFAESFFNASKNN